MSGLQKFDVETYKMSNKESQFEDRALSFYAISLMLTNQILYVWDVKIQGQVIKTSGYMAVQFIEI